MQTAPHATNIAHDRWLAVVNFVAAASERRLGPRAVALTIEPMTATPRTLPICRDVDAIAEATPARSGGIPLTAVWVMGGFTRPNPQPRST